MAVRHREQVILANQRTFDPARVDHRIPLNKVERWRFLRQSGSEPHIVHIYATDALVFPATEYTELTKSEYPDYIGVLKETFRLGPIQHVVGVVVHFTDHRGRFVLHCHMLAHEDSGMMAQFEVT